MINNEKNFKLLPVYGGGMQIRDWLYVKDCCEDIDMVVNGGKFGEIYNGGGHNVRPNIFVVKTTIEHRHDRLNREGISEKLIKNVEDRLRRDRCYGIDSTKIKNDLCCIHKLIFRRALYLLSIGVRRMRMDNVISSYYKKY